MATSSKDKKDKKSSSSGKKSRRSKSSLEKEFEAMVDSLAIKGEKRKQMLAMSEAQKREMLKGFQSIKTAPSAAEPPSYYVQKLKEQISVSDLGKLTVSLVSKPIEWIESFIQANGLLPLVDLLAASIDAEPKSKDNLKIISSIITCIKGLMNAHEGAIRSVASVGGSFLALVRALEHVDVKGYRRIWEILGGLTIISPEAHRISLQALQEPFKGKDGQTTGLSVLRGALEKGDLNTRPVALCFANGLINRSTSIATRGQLRRDIGLVDEQNELSTLFDQLGMVQSDALGLQLHYFEEVFEGDKDELESEGGLIFVIDQLVKEIADLLMGSPALQWFPDILRDMKLLRTDGEPASITWRLVDMWVQKLVSTQCAEGTEIAEFATDVSKSLLDSLGIKHGASSAEPQESLPADREKIEQQRELINSMKADIKKLKAGKKEFERSQVVLENLRAELERETGEHANLSRELQGLRGQLASAEESQTGLKSQLATANERLQAAEAAAVNVVVDEETKQKLVAAEATITKLKDELADARSAAAASSSSDAAPVVVVAAPSSSPSEADEKLVKQVKDLEAELAQAHANLQALKSAAPSEAVVVAAAPAGTSTEDANKIKALEAELAASQARMLKLESELTAALAAAAAGASSVPPPPPPPPGGPVGAPPPPPPPPPGGPPPPPGGPPPPPGAPPPPPGGPPPPPGGPPPPPGGPPPPPGGPPPPPGGPPGSGPPAAPAMGRPKKAQPKPPVKMRVFNWVKLADAKVDNTWWDTKITDAGVNVPTAELDALFGLVEKPAADESSEAASSSGARGPAKQMKLTVLEGNRGNNVNIVMNRFNKLPIETVKSSILEGDPEFLSPDNIKALLVLAPNPEEVSAIAEHADDPNLGPAEQFLWALSKIPQLQVRLEAAQLASAFERRFEEVNESVTAIKNATEEVSISRKLIELLKLVLAIGNYINGSTPRGGAYGIKLASLGKLADVRSGTGETLIHYMASLCEKSHPELLTIAEDMPSLAGAARENLNDVTSDAQNLNNEVQAVGNKLNGVADGPFKNRMQAFLGKAAPQAEQLVATVTKTKTSFSQLLVNLGELPDSSTADFFTLINNFVVQFTRALAENKQRAENERKKAEMAAKRAAQQAASGKSAASSSDATASEGGVLDGMLAQAAAGGVARLRPAAGRGGPMPGMGIPIGVDLRAGLRKAGGGPSAPTGAPAGEAAAPIDFRAGLKKRTDGAAAASSSTPAPADAPAVDFRAGLRKRAPTDEQPKEAPAPAVVDFRAGLKKRTDGEE